MSENTSLAIADGDEKGRQNIETRTVHGGRPDPRSTGGRINIFDLMVGFRKKSPMHLYQYVDIDISLTMCTKKMGV